jgi:O-acetylhomoserine (thiol)-lyase
VAHAHGVPLIVDNTVATPILLRPIEHGADIVVHSLTKFMGGHGTTWAAPSSTAATSTGSQHAARFPMFNQPDSPITAWSTPSTSAAAAYIARCRSVYQRTTGAVLSPLSAFLLLQGIETVALRVERHVENGRKVAEFLRARPAGRMGQLRRLSRQPLLRAGAEISRRPRLLADDLRHQGRLRGRCKDFYDALKLITGWSISATPSRSPAIRLRPPTGRCRPRNSARPACCRK